MSDQKPIKCPTCDGDDIQENVCLYCDGTGEDYDPHEDGDSCLECDGTGEDYNQHCCITCNDHFTSDDINTAEESESK